VWFAGFLNMSYKKAILFLEERGGVERSALIRDEHDGWFLGSDGIRIRPSKQNHAEYLALQFQSHRVQGWLTQNAIGTTMASLNQEILTRVEIPLPPTKAEQEAVAKVLGDADALIKLQEQLVAKKRHLKQGVMQELIAGKRRLSGFSGEWECSTLKQAAEIHPGVNKPISEMGSGTLYVTVQDLYDATSIRTERLGRIRVSMQEVIEKSLVPGDIIFGKSSVKRDGIGYPSQFLGCSEAVVFTGFAYRARARQDIADADFLFHSLRSSKTRQWLIDNSQASALTNINQSIANTIPVLLPPLAEQIAIATILSDMDADIAALEAKLAKARKLKLGMMQELLTGRIRLV